MIMMYRSLRVSVSDYASVIWVNKANTSTSYIKLKLYRFISKLHTCPIGISHEDIEIVPKVETSSGVYSPHWGWLQVSVPWELSPPGRCPPLLLSCSAQWWLLWHRTSQSDSLCHCSGRRMKYIANGSYAVWLLEEKWTVLTYTSAYIVIYPALNE